MKNSLPVLNVNMLGRFSMTYGNQTITFKRNPSTKSLHLLQLLLHSTNGISRVQLLEILYGQEEVSDVSNNLRVTIFRLKKQLIEAGLPKYDYIHIENGNYFWKSPMETKLDIIEFENFIQTAYKKNDEEQKITLLYHAIQLYRGEFLPLLSGEDWVIIHSVQYKKLYTKAFLEVCNYLKKKHEYRTLLEVSEAAIKIYPFEEWQTIKIEALLALNRYKEALQYYEETSKMFFEELGISPSERMIQIFKSMSNKMYHNYSSSIDIKNEFYESAYEIGGFYCNLPSFRDCFRLIQRMIERNHQHAYMVICSITDKNGHPLEQKEKLEVLSQTLHKSIKNSIRRGDCFTKYSPSQFIILLIVDNEEICNMIYTRILTHFIQKNNSWKNNITKTIYPVHQ